MELAACSEYMTSISAYLNVFTLALNGPLHIPSACNDVHAAMLLWSLYDDIIGIHCSRSFVNLGTVAWNLSAKKLMHSLDLHNNYMLNIKN